ncbi:MAG: hypothetical protein NC201_01270 [Prevotella sp.]|nr:hypothetical protein [Bacteroides sp.]MCM1365858.1 hypothetical protein [Prevotella sp.]
MKTKVIAGLMILALVYLWLCRYLVLYAGGFTMKNVLIIIISGIIIFVPLYKKYIRHEDR